MSEPLEFDGERFTPESVREIWYEHMHRYAFAAQFVAGLSVLDAACGEGYGAAILARKARSVTAVDRSEKAISHARRRYAAGNVEFSEADCCDLPFDDHRFDCIVSFETIEHLEDQAGMLAEFRRVLKPSGFLLISSPDKAVYSDQQNFDNPHHVRELYADEFRAVLDAHFPASRMFGQKLLFHSAIWAIGGEGSEASSEASGRTLEARLQSAGEDGPREIERPVQPAMYLLAICAASEAALPQIEHALWLFDDAEESVYRHYQHEIRKNMQAGTILAEREQALAERGQALVQAREELAAARSEPERQRSWLARLGLSRRERR
jgi:SAM-dependent methyltransferase